MMRAELEPTRYRLLQEDLGGNLWKVLVASILLNKTKGEQVKRISKKFFEKWPTPESARPGGEAEVRGAIASLGLGNRRVKTIIDLSGAIARDPPLRLDDVVGLPGVGRYALESCAIFAFGITDFKPQDRVLKNYLERKNHERHEK